MLKMYLFPFFPLGSRAFGGVAGRGLREESEEVEDYDEDGGLAGAGGRAGAGGVGSLGGG